MARPKSKVVPLPDSSPADFQRATFRTGFQLTLTQPMIQFLCAVADDCVWDRTGHLGCGQAIHNPDTSITTSAALIKRGLIRWKPEGTRARYHDKDNPDFGDCWENITAYHELTPIGECVVQMFRAAGVFVEADSATIRKSKVRRRA